MKNLSKGFLMKSLRGFAFSVGITAIGGVSTLLTASPAQAAIFNFSYKFPLNNGDVLDWQGKISGDLLSDGNTVKISREVPFPSFLVGTSEICPSYNNNNCNVVYLFERQVNNTLFTRFTLDGSDVVGRAGSLRDALKDSGDFVLVSTKLSDANDYGNGGLGYSTPFAIFSMAQTPFVINRGSASPGLQPYKPSHWTATAEEEKVPEPSTIVGLATAIGFFPLLKKAYLRRQKKN